MNLTPLLGVRVTVAGGRIGRASLLPFAFQFFEILSAILQVFSVLLMQKPIPFEMTLEGGRIG